MHDRSVGRAWYDAYELERRRSLGQRLRLNLAGALVLADDVTPELVAVVFESVRIRGGIRGPRAAKHAVKRIRDR